ncbi:MAG: hypothetical protein ACTSPV_18390 [Candidatus Hodarchaeales archaeon]
MPPTYLSSKLQFLSSTALQEQSVINNRGLLKPPEIKLENLSRFR